MSEATEVTTKGFFIGSSIREAWKIFKEEWITIYVVNALPLIIAVLFSMSVSNLDENSGMAVLANLVYLLVQLVVGMGVMKAMISIARGKKVTTETFTSNFPNTLRYLGAQFLMGLIVVGGLLLFIIPGIIFSLKYMFTSYLVVDKGLGPIEALKASSKLTDGIKWDLLGFLIAVAVLMYSGILALFVGLIVTIPIGTMAYVVLYNSLVKRK